MGAVFVRQIWPEGYGERLLLAAIIRRAAFDIALYKASPRIHRRRWATEAFHWMMSDDDSHFTSFISICTILDQDPSEIRRKTMKLKREDVKKFDMVVN